MKSKVYSIPLVNLIWFLLVLMSLNLWCSATAQKIHHKLNYGIMFEKKGTVHFGKDEWTHTFQIKMPVKKSSFKLDKCNDKAICEDYNRLISAINMIQKQNEFTLNETVNIIKSLVPLTKTHTKITKGKSKRAILSFVGQLSKTLFGTATMDDVNILAQHINALTVRTIKLTNAMSQHDKHESSFMASVDKRISNLVTEISNNHKELNDLQKTLANNVYDMESFILKTETIILQTIAKSTEFGHQLNQLKLGIFELAKGQLSPLLIKPVILTQTIENIQLLLNRDYPGFYITQKHPDFYYASSDFIYRKHKSDIYVLIKIPLAFKTSQYDLLEVTSFPFPINNSLHASQLLNVPRYIAVSPKSKYYLSLSDKDFAKCSGHKNNFHCPLLNSFNSSKESCLLSILNENKENIKSFCDFRFIHNAISPKIISLSHSSLLVYRTPELNIDCSGKQEIRKGCEFCILQLPCKCSVITKNLYIPPSLTHCKTSRKISTVYPVNLALMQQFFDNNQLQGIMANSTFLKLPNIEIPKFKMYNHAFSSFLSNDQKNHLSLTKMADATKKESMVFHDLAEPLLEGVINVKANWPDLNGILGITGTALASFSVLFSIWAFFKIRKLATIIAVLQNTNRVTAMTVPSFIYKPIETTPTSSPLSINLFNALEFNHILVAIIGILIATVFIMYLYKRKKTSHHSFLMLEITTGSSCSTVRICSLPLCPPYWEFSGMPNIKNIDITGYFKPKLIIEWDDFSITNKLTHKSINGPNTVDISFWKALQIKQMLKHPFFVHVLLSHQNMYKVINEP